MSNEALIGIILTVVFGVASLLVVNKKSSFKINQKTKNGNNSISNTTIGNEINKDKSK